MANFINDKEIHDIINISALIDRRDTYTRERNTLIKTITYQLDRQDSGMSRLGRARLVAKLVNRLDELDAEIERLNDEIDKYEPICYDEF
jgi:uncharacterized protein YlxW (UPF0749 family)